jgi:hypothetical protein
LCRSSGLLDCSVTTNSCQLLERALPKELEALSIDELKRRWKACADDATGELNRLSAELERRWNECADDLAANRLRDVLKQRNMFVALRGAKAPPPPPFRVADGLPVALRNRWLFELKGAVRAQPELNRRLTPMVSYERGQHLVKLFVRLVSDNQPIDPVLLSYIAWGLASRDPLLMLGLKRPHAGNPAPSVKMTDAQREEYTQLLERSIDRARRSRAKGSERYAHAGGDGSARNRVIETFCNDTGISVRWAESLLANLKTKKRRQPKRLRPTGEIIGSGTTPPLLTNQVQVPNGVPMNPADLLEMLRARNILDPITPLPDEKTP